MPAHDVVIVGAAPAGAIAALILARAGKRVAVLDRAAFPRSKVCGNCINPAAWKIWEQLGLADAFQALPHQALTGFAIHCEGRTIYEHAFASPRQAPRCVGRDVLDDWLLREAVRAGAECFPETTVTGVEPGAGTVQTTRGDFSGRLIFGADGRNSIVARQSGLMPPPRRCHRVAWQASIPAPADLDARVHMHLFEEGYFGFTRYSPTHAVVSMVLDARRSQDPLPFARKFLPSFPAVEWLRMNPITRAPARVGAGRVWLLGDAARVVEPFTGEGISFALSTGLLAAGNANRALDGGDLDGALLAYGAKHRRLYRRRAWVNALVSLALVTPSHSVRFIRRMERLPRFVVNLLSRHVHAPG